jgi:hypothetical protein
MSNSANRVLYIVRTWVPEETLDDWLEWQTTVHVPGIVAQPEVVRAQIYRVAEDATPAEWLPQYVTMYEFASWDDWVSYRDGDAAAGFRAAAMKYFGTTGKISRQVLVEEVSVENL